MSAHFLSKLLDCADKKLFPSVIVVSGRNVIDSQLQGIAHGRTGQLFGPMRAAHSSSGRAYSFTHLRVAEDFGDLILAVRRITSEDHLLVPFSLRSGPQAGVLAQFSAEPLINEGLELGRGRRVTLTRRGAFKIEPERLRQEGRDRRSLTRFAGLRSPQRPPQLLALQQRSETSVQK